MIDNEITLAYTIGLQVAVVAPIERDVLVKSFQLNKKYMNDVLSRVVTDAVEVWFSDYIGGNNSVTVSIVSHKIE